MVNIKHKNLPSLRKVVNGFIISNDILERAVRTFIVTL